MTLPPRPSTPFLCVIALTVVLRGLTAWFGPDHFNDDRDVYLGIAQGIAAGRGFCEPGTARPTAYRPPLYPLLLAPVSSTGMLGKAGRALLHIALAVGMVAATWLAGRRLGLSTWNCCVASLLLICDPLLILYANFPMTETLCAALGACLVARFSLRETTVSCWVLTGIVCGLCVLARPTFWIAIVLMAAGSMATRKLNWSSLGVALVGVLATTAPWVIRNQWELGHPIAMTTHGGYTLLLGNNADFYEQVTAHSFSTVWEGAGQQQWVDRINHEMDALDLRGEVARDEWMGREAKQTITQQPQMFAKASLARLIQFWNVLPGGEPSRDYPTWVLWSVAAFYVAAWLMVLAGLLRILRSRDWGWLPAVLLPLAFTLVHAVYWSNIRMRAPVMPAVVLIAALGMERRRDTAA